MSLNLDLIYSEFNFSVANGADRITYIFDEYRLDIARKMLYRGGEELALPPKAVETLIVLLKKRGEIVSKNDLISLIWTDTIVEESNLAHYLHVLRKTLGTRSDGKPFIETFRRRGYRFDAEVQIVRELPDSAEKALHNSDEPILRSARLDADFRLENGAAETSRETVSAQSPLISKPRLMLAAFVGAAVLGLLFFLYFQKLSAKSSLSSTASREFSITNLTNNSGLFSGAISRDGKYFVYVELKDERYHLYVQQTGQTSRLEVIPPTEKAIFANTFSPDGAHIYFAAFDKSEKKTALYRVPTLGGTSAKIVDDIYSQVSFSPDGRELVYAKYSEETKESALVIASTDGSRERVLLTRDVSAHIPTGGAWSPDGGIIAFGEVKTEASLLNGKCSIMSIELQTGETKPFSTEKWDNCFRMDWTRDGKGLFFVGTRAGEGLSTRRDQVFYLSAATGESRRVTSDGSRYDSATLNVTDDNAIFAVAANNLSQIWATESSGEARAAVQLTNGQADGRAGIAPLPDGRIGYISRTGENIGIWTINADGSNQKQIFNELPYFEELRAAPDGRYFVLSAPRDGFNHLYRIDTDGANLKQLTAGNSSEIDSSVSPDGNWVFYVSGIYESGNIRYELRKTSIDGSQTLKISDVQAAVPHVSPDGKYVSLVAGEKLLVLTADEGKLLKTFETVKPAILNIGTLWSRDGKNLIYSVERKNVSNLWMQPLDGGNPRPLTDFTSGSIYNFAFSADGKRIYMARGYPIRNAVLIKNFIN